MGLCAFFLIFMTGCDKGTVSTHFPKFEGFIVLRRIGHLGYIRMDSVDTKKTPKPNSQTTMNKNSYLFTWIAIA